MQDQLLTVPEVAQVLQVSRSYVYWLTKRRKLLTVRLGRAVRVHPSDLNAYIRSNRPDAAAIAPAIPNSPRL